MELRIITGNSGNVSFEGGVFLGDKLLPVGRAQLTLEYGQRPRLDMCMIVGVPGKSCVETSVQEFTVDVDRFDVAVAGTDRVFVALDPTKWHFAPTSERLPETFIHCAHGEPDGTQAAQQFVQGDPADAATAITIDDRTIALGPRQSVAAVREGLARTLDDSWKRGFGAGVRKAEIVLDQLDRIQRERVRDGAFQATSGQLRQSVVDEEVATIIGAPPEDRPRMLVALMERALSQIAAGVPEPGDVAMRVIRAKLAVDRAATA